MTPTPQPGPDAEREALKLAAARLLEIAEVREEEWGAQTNETALYHQEVARDIRFVIAATAALTARAERAEAEIARLRTAFTRENDDICQALGTALGYPWFCDDQANFPGATRKNGVCVGDHVAASIAQEAAAEIAKLREALDSPHNADWLEGVRVEAPHQQLRYPPEHDANKNPWDWFWLIGYLAQKAAAAALALDHEKAKHHTISTGAALLNWPEGYGDGSNSGSTSGLRRIHQSPPDPASARRTGVVSAPQPRRPIYLTPQESDLIHRALMHVAAGCREQADSTFKPLARLTGLWMHDNLRDVAAKFAPLPVEPPS